MLEEFKKIVGNEEYPSLLKPLRGIGPSSRTHRISVVIAAILRFALMSISDDYEDGSLEEALVVVDEDPYSDGEEYRKLTELVNAICREAGMENYRVSARGAEYSISDNALSEYSSWYNMPWEDY